LDAAQRVIAQISRPAAIGALRLQVGASIGVAIFPGDGDRPSVLIRSADEAMYAAKRAGRGRVEPTPAFATWSRSGRAAQDDDGSSGLTPVVES
jgi:predicted signal transduction protein with EAL and GGDEF domain